MPYVCNGDLTKATCQLSIPSNSLFPVSKYNCLSSVKESLHTAAASELGSVFITPNYGDGWRHFAITPRIIDIAINSCIVAEAFCKVLVSFPVKLVHIRWVYKVYIGMLLQAY